MKNCLEVSGFLESNLFSSERRKHKQKTIISIHLSTYLHERESLFLCFLFFCMSDKTVADLN